MLFFFWDKVQRLDIRVYFLIAASFIIHQSRSTGEYVQKKLNNAGHVLG